MLMFILSALAAAPTYCPALAKEGFIEGDGRTYAKWEVNSNFRLSAEQIDAVQRFVAAFGEESMRLVVAVVPPRPAVDPSPILVKGSPYDRDDAIRQYRGTLRWLARAGAVPVDLLDAAMTLTETPFFFPVDDHWTPAGAWETAKRVKAAVAALPEYGAIPKMEWVTTLSETVAEGSGVTKRCGAGVGEITIPVYVTEPKNGGSASLLDDTPPPRIVHVGSSLSGGRLNFGGFLRQELERDVMSVPVAGGRALSAMATWLSSDEYRASKPKIVIWEMELGHLYWPGKPDAPSTLDADYFREVVPMVHGDCGATALAAQTSTLSGGEMQLLAVPKGVSAAGTGWWLVLDGGALSLAGASVKTTYADGSDTHTLADYGRVEEHGPRFLELAPERVGRLQRVALVSELPLAGALTTRLCHR